MCLTEALALVGGSINEHLGGDHISKRKEHLHQLSITKFLRQVVDEEVAAFRSWDGATCQSEVWVRYLINNSILRKQYWVKLFRVEEINIGYLHKKKFWHLKTSATDQCFKHCDIFCGEKNVRKVTGKYITYKRLLKTFNISIHSIMCERQVFKGWVLHCIVTH